jgi:hypothetical protein
VARPFGAGRTPPQVAPASGDAGFVREQGSGASSPASPPSAVALAVLLDADARRVCGARVRIGLAVAAAHLLEFVGAHLRSRLARAGDVGRAAMRALEVAELIARARGRTTAAAALDADVRLRRCGRFGGRGRGHRRGLCVRRRGLGFGGGRGLRLGRRARVGRLGGRPGDTAGEEQTKPDGREGGSHVRGIADFGPACRMFARSRAFFLRCRRAVAADCASEGAEYNMAKVAHYRFAAQSFRQRARGVGSGLGARLVPSICPVTTASLARYPSIMKIAIELSTSQAERLHERAKSLGIQPEELARAAVADLLAERDEDFRAAAEHILQENAELYRRLA